MPFEATLSEETSPRSRRVSGFAKWGAAAVVAAGVLAALPTQEAHAQSTSDAQPVTGTAKGIVGGAFLGAEVVMMPMGIAGLKPWWPYLVFGGLGSVGGAIGGWAVEQAVADGGPAEAPLYMLAGGLALVIPTLVVTLNATTKSDFDDEEDPSVLPASDDGQPAPGAVPGAVPAGGDTNSITVQKTSMLRKKRARPSRPVALFDMAGGDLRVGVPVVEVRKKYSEDEMAEFGVEQRDEYHVPVFKAAF